ncbi:MAG: InlB B-repeat-containing protein [Paludibacteraceae bacterium]|nr:InlB B-repeat-containing protein [Paludibacteraceae bacterium]
MKLSRFVSCFIISFLCANLLWLSAYADSYTLTAATNTGDGSGITACTTLPSAVFSTGSDYVSAISEATKAYYNGGSGIKLGTSSVVGTLSLNLSSSGQVFIDNIVVSAKRYSASKAVTLSISSTDGSASLGSSSALSLTADFADYTYTPTSTDSKTTIISFESSKYCWIESITVNYTPEAPSGCTNTVTITKGAETNGTFTISDTEVCGDGDGATITVTPTPDAGYAVSAVTTTTSGMVTPPTPTTSDYTVSGITANTTINVSFTALPTHTISFDTGGGSTVSSITAYEGEEVDLTAITTPTTSSICNYRSFYGWSETPVALNTTTTPTVLTSYTMGTADKTLYAVYKKAVPTGNTQTDHVTSTEISTISGTSYTDNRSFNSSEGLTWGGFFAIGTYNTSYKSLQINKNQLGYHIATAIYNGIITEIEITAYKTSAQSRTILLLDNTNNKQPTEGTHGTFELGADIAANVQTTQSFSFSTNQPSQLFIYSLNAVYVSSIIVTYDEASFTYSSDPDCSATAVGYRMSYNGTTLEFTQKDATSIWETPMQTLTATGLAADYYVGLANAVPVGQTGDITAYSGTVTETLQDNMQYRTGYAETYETLTAASVGWKGVFRIDTNSSADNYNCYFVPYLQVSFNKNGGSGSNISPIPATPVAVDASSAGLNITLPTCTFTPPAGKKFLEWNTQADGDGAPYAEGSTYPNLTMGSVTPTTQVLYAIWTDASIYTVTLHTVSAEATGVTDGQTLTQETEGEAVILPVPQISCGRYNFAGWATAQVTASTGTRPTLYNGTYTPTANIDLYAVYRKPVTTSHYQLVTDASTLSAGDVVLLANAANSAVSSTFNSTYLNKESATFSQDLSTITATVATGLMLDGEEGAWKLISSSGQLFTNTSNNLNLTGTGTGTYAITINASNNEATIAPTGMSGSRFLYNKSSTRFKPYASTTVVSASMLMPQLYRSNATYSYISDPACLETCQTPVFTPVAGEYTETQSVTITCATGGATIYYTTDGTEPTSSSTPYTTAIEVSATTTIKAIAVKAGLENSDVATATYTISVPDPTITEFNLVEDLSELEVGKHIVIMAVASDIYYALSTTQNSNNRAAVTEGFTMSNSNKTVTLGATNDVQIIELTDEGEGLLGFYTGSGYLYAANSGSNQLKTQAANDDNGKWKITLTEGVFSVVAQGTNTRNQLKFNNGSPKLFSCYSGGQTDVLIYIEPDNCTAPATALGVEATPANITTITSTTLNTTGGNGGAVTYTIISDNAANANLSGTTFTATVPGVYTIQALQPKNNGECKQTATTNITVSCDVKWSINGTISKTSTISQSMLLATDFPTTPADDFMSDCANKFMGWTNQNLGLEPSDEPALLFSSATDAPQITDESGAGYVTFYAVFATLDMGEGSYRLVTDASTLQAGDKLVFASTDNEATAGDISSSIMTAVTSEFSENGKTITTLGRGTIEFTLGGAEGAWTLTSDNGFLSATAVKKLAWDSETDTWDISITDGDATISSTNSDFGKFLYNVGNPRFTTYTSTPTSSMVLPQLYRKEAGASNFITECDPTKATISYVLKGGEMGAGCITKLIIDKGDSHTVCSAEPTYEGRVFTGWLCSDGNTYQAGDVIADIQQNLKLTAQWVYRITYSVNGATDIEPTVDINPGDALILPTPTQPAECDGWDFLGWTTTPISGTVQSVASLYESGTEVVPTATRTLYAVYGYGMGGDIGKYTLVKDAESLTEGSQVVIVALDYNYALSTDQNANNRSYVEITKEDETVSWENNAAVCEFIVEKGTSQATWAFYDGSLDGYIYAASASSNYLRTETDLSDNSSFGITINAETGEAFMQAQGENTRDVIQYNNSNHLFSCYAADNAMSPVAIYQKSGQFNYATTCYTLTLHTITIAELHNGTAVVAKNDVIEGSGTKLTINPSEGYAIGNITITPADGCTLSGTDGNRLLTNVTKDIEIDVTFTKLPTYSITFHNLNTGEEQTENQTISTSKITLPKASVSPACLSDGWEFAGWMEGSAQTEETTTAPVLRPAGQEILPTDDMDLYAVFKLKTGGSSTATRVTATSGLVEGRKYIIGSKDNSVTAGTLSDTYLKPIESTFGSTNITAVAEGTVEFTLGVKDGHYALLVGTDSLGTDGAKRLTIGDEFATNLWDITFDGGNAAITSLTESYGAIYYNASAPRFTTYTKSGQKPVQIYNSPNLSVKYKSDPACVTCEEATYSFERVSIKKVPTAEPFTNTFTSTNQMPMRWSSDNAAVATVDAESGEITIVGQGSCVITVKQAKDNTNQLCALEATFPLVVKEPTIDVVEVSPNTIVLEHDYDGDVQISLWEQETTIVGSVADKVFFSKYFEAASNMKLFAIYNGTDHDIDMTELRVRATGKSKKWSERQGDFGYVELASISRLRKDFGEAMLLPPGTELIFWSNNFGEGNAQTYNAYLRECVSMEINGVNYDYDDMESGAVPNWYCLGDPQVYNRKDADGNNQFVFNGDDALILEEKDVDGNWQIIDLFGAGTAEGTNTDAVEQIKDKYTINGTEQPLNDNPGGWHCLHPDSIVPFSTNRYMLFRNKDVLSGLNAVAHNTDDFVTLCTEWSGHPVGGSAGSGAENYCYSGTMFSELGQMDYAKFYTDLKIIDLPAEKFKKDPITGTVTVTIDDLTDRACSYMQIKVKNGDNELAKNDYKVPIIVTGSDVTTQDAVFTDLGRTTCKTCDVVVYKNAKLTKSETGDINRFRDLEVYPNGEFVLPSGRSLTVNTLTMRAKDDTVSSAVLDGNLTRTATLLYHDKRITNSRWYWLTLPYRCNIKDVTFDNGDPAVLGADWALQYYDGEVRSATQQTGWSYFTGTTIERGQGFIVAISGREGHKYSTLRFPMADYDETADPAVPVGNYGAGTDVRPNHKGWNLVGNPFFSKYNNMPDDGLILGKLAKDYDTESGRWYGKWTLSTDDGNVPYITIPQDAGYSEYIQQKISDFGTLPTFTSYFIQVGGDTPQDDLGVQFLNLDRKNAVIARRQAEKTESPTRVCLTLTNEGNETDETSLMIAERFNDTYEVGADLLKWRGTYYNYAQITTKPVLASRNNDAELAFNALAPESAENGVPLNFFAAKEGNYTFRLSGRTDITELETVYLYDSREKTTTDLLLQDYTFQTARTDDKSRFIIYAKVKPKPLVPTDLDDSSAGVLLTTVDKTLILAGLPQDATIYVYSTEGKLVSTAKTESAGSMLRFCLPQTGVYNVRVVTPANAETYRTIIK